MVSSLVYIDLACRITNPICTDHSSFIVYMGKGVRRANGGHVCNRMWCNVAIYMCATVLQPDVNLY